jgi:phytoene dehydrogenase-like protein
MTHGISMTRATHYDAVIVGSGPNGLAAAITLARAGRSVLVIEGRDTVGGGMRTAELTLPGFRHDICSAAHPLGMASPFFRSLPLEQHGLRWIQPDAPLAHPLDHGQAVVLDRSFDATAAYLGRDAAAYRRLIEPLAGRWQEILGDLLGPLSVPSHPVSFARFGAGAILPAATLARTWFRGQRARALFAGLAAHSIMPLQRPLTAAYGLMLGLLAHGVGWPMPAGGSQAIADTLASYLRSLGGEIRTGWWVRSLAELPPAAAYLFDITPRDLLKIAGDALPAGYRRALSRYRYGPGVFKLDYALDGPVPWRNPVVNRGGTVHVGGTLDEIAASEQDAWQGRHAERPFVLVVQPSLFDLSRAPAGQHVLWAYCHVPNGSTVDMTAAIEGQIERFAPGFRDRILARHAMNAMQMEQYNPNYVGGDINSGVQDLFQHFTRPAVRISPYTTPNPRIFLCSSATPPGGGVHGMCGYWAAQAALRRLNP